MSNIEKLKALLEVDREGEKMADMINKMIIDDRKRNILFSKLDDMQKQFSTLGQEVKLTKSEEAVKELVLCEKRPLTSQDVTEMISDNYKSLKYQTHASSALNSLVKKGVLGRIKLGYLYYHSSPKEAVIEQLKKRGETAESCSPEEISKQSGMPINTVMDVLEELQG
ncbi:MAG: hypothetical protein SVM80_10205 [Halobacteriota archaeon]|nr:hypothetical protein [Halobacteriota archaeon]